MLFSVNVKRMGEIKYDRSFSATYSVSYSIGEQAIDSFQYVTYCGLSEEQSMMMEPRDYRNNLDGKSKFMFLCVLNYYARYAEDIELKIAENILNDVREYHSVRKFLGIL